MTIIQQQSFQNPLYFDFVVLNDQTRRMANEEAREDSIDAITQAYAPLIKASRAKPVFIDTHAFYFQNDGQYSNQTYVNGYLGSSISAFTAAIYEGLYQYVDELGALLPKKQAPLIAPVGLAYLAIFEDNPEKWRTLFSDDGIHASQAGTYLTACVLYCTMYGHLPAAVHSDYDMRKAFFRSRSLYGNTTSTPTLNQANYLRKWAKKVAVDGYIPKTMVMPTRNSNSDSQGSSGNEANYNYWANNNNNGEEQEQNSYQAAYNDQGGRQ
jgi:hypothetical protein